MSKKMNYNDFESGETLTYTGRGFIGFRTNDRKCEFVRYGGVTDAWIKYDGYNVFVSKYDLERPKKEANA